MAYKAMRRSIMETKHDAELRETASKVYKAIGLELPEERTEAERMQPRMHGGCELVSTFVPTPKGPTLNVVHGPNAADDDLLRLPKQVVGLPIVGAAAGARMRAELPSAHGRKMEVDEDFSNVDTRPYFYPRRARQSGRIRKKVKRSEKQSAVRRRGVR